MDIEVEHVIPIADPVTGAVEFRTRRITLRLDDDAIDAIDAALRERRHVKAVLAAGGSAN